MMIRFMLPLLLAGILAMPLWADDAEQATKDKKTTDPAAQELLENPNDAEKLNRYFGDKFGAISAKLSSAPDAAGADLKNLQEFADGLKPDDPRSKALVTRARNVIELYNKRLALMRLPLEEVKEQLTDDPANVQLASDYLTKLSGELGTLAEQAPEKAGKQLAEAKEFFASIKEKAGEDAKETLDRLESQWFGRLEAGLKKQLLIGTDAAPLEVKVFVNGDALTDADLKGKVVLLDFWAVWCGPCIRTFPHLREWQAKYDEKDFVIIGLTRYYNYEWDDDAGRAKRASEKVAAEQEHEMLERFAEEHQLQHRFAIQTDGVLSDFYGVTGIPQAVVIDREGKIRLIKVGSGEENAKAIDELLEKLIEG